MKKVKAFMNLKSIHSVYNLYRKQLNLIVIPLIICDLYDTFHAMYFYYITEPLVFYKPESNLDAILDFLNVFCDSVITFTFYLAFYWILRDYFKPADKKEEKMRLSENFIDEENLKRDSIMSQKTSKTIEQYFEE